MKRAEASMRASVLRKKYAEIGMTGTARLIDFLGSKHGYMLVEFGSSSIGPSGNGRLYIGRPKAEPPVSPLEDMERNLPILAELSEEQRKVVDGVLGAIGESMWRIHSPRYQIPFAIRQFIIRMHYRFGWKVSEDLGMGVRWWWLPQPVRKMLKQWRSARLTRSA